MLGFVLCFFESKIRIGNGEPRHHPEKEEYAVIVKNEIRRALYQESRKTGEKRDAHQLFGRIAVPADEGKSARRQNHDENEKCDEREYAHFNNELQIQAVTVVSHLRAADGVQGIYFRKCALACPYAGNEIFFYHIERAAPDIYPV